jgi:two-component system sensor histidine kinase VicK
MIFSHLVLIISVIGVTTLVLSFVFWRISKRHGGASKGTVSTLASSLRDEKAKADIIVNTIEDGVILIDNQKQIQVFSPGASRLTGWPQNEAEGLSFESVIKIVDSKGQPYEDKVNPFNRIFAELKPLRDNTAFLLTRSNKQIPINVSVSPLLDNNQQVTAAVAILRDETQERQEEQQRAEFISTASHEMRTPVAAIEGYLSLALSDKVSTIDSRARDYLEKAHSSTTHLGTLFQDLLTSAKAEDGRLSNHPGVVEIGGFLAKLVEDLKFSAEKKGLAIDFVMGTGELIDATNETDKKVIKPLYYVWADADRLSEVVTNLFDNAVKYTDAGKISLGLTGDPRVVQMFVRDTGPGIPNEDIPHLFQKFYRVDNSATRTIGGTGLGLFICRKIIELYQGRIWVESTQGKGSTFFINLPRLDTKKAEEMLAVSSTAGSSSVSNALATT